MPRKIDIARAERIFSTGGFFLQYLPVVAVMFCVICAAIVMPTNAPSLLFVSVAAGCAVVGVLTPAIWNYFSMREAHFRLKTQYGQRYIDMVENGIVDLSATSIMFNISKSQAEKLSDPPDPPPSG